MRGFSCPMNVYCWLCLYIFFFTLPSGHLFISQNIKISDRKKIRNDIQLIKDDCGEICDTSIKGEGEIHKG